MSSPKINSRKETLLSAPHMGMSENWEFLVEGVPNFEKHPDWGKRPKLIMQFVKGEQKFQIGRKKTSKGQGSRKNSQEPGGPRCSHHFVSRLPGDHVVQIRRPKRKLPREPLPKLTALWTLFFSSADRQSLGERAAKLKCTEVISDSFLSCLGVPYIVLQVSGIWRARTGVLLSRHIGFTALLQTLPLGQQTKQPAARFRLLWAFALTKWASSRVTIWSKVRS